MIIKKVFNTLLILFHKKTGERLYICFKKKDRTYAER
jgi:hypothetical protein